MAKNDVVGCLKSSSLVVDGHWEGAVPQLRDLNLNQRSYHHHWLAGQ